MQARLSRPTPVRFRPETEARIKKAAERFGIRPASLIRYAVDSQLAAFDRDGQIVIPAERRTAAR